MPFIQINPYLYYSLMKTRRIVLIRLLSKGIEFLTCSPHFNHESNGCSKLKLVDVSRRERQFLEKIKFCKEVKKRRLKKRN